METATNLNNETLSGLQDLIRINIDSAEGFRSAADKIESEHVATLFRDCAAERERFSNELKSYVRMNNETPEESGSVAGTLHRWWLELRGTVQDGKEHAVLSEAERGEDAIKEKYESVLKDSAGSAVNDVLQQQYAAVKARHDQIRDMRDARR